jgi:hypothetical protein
MSLDAIQDPAIKEPLILLTTLNELDVKGELQPV